MSADTAIWRRRWSKLRAWLRNETSMQRAHQASAKRMRDCVGERAHATAANRLDAALLEMTDLTRRPTRRTS